METSGEKDPETPASEPGIEPAPKESEIESRWADHVSIRSLQDLAAAEEIANGYFYQRLRRNITRRIPINAGLPDIIDFISAAFDLASAASSMPAKVTGRVAYNIKFKNDADVIILPLEIRVPRGYYYNSAPHLMMPGETSECKIRIHPANIVDASLEFIFYAITSDPDILPPSPNSPVPSWDAVPRFSLIVNMTRSRCFLGQVSGFNTVAWHLLGDNQTALRYVGHRATPPAPSFGVSMIDTLSGAQAGNVIGNTIVFTPLQNPFL